MNRKITVAALVGAMGLAGLPLSVAIPQTAAQLPALSGVEAEARIFAIENMTCALCPVTVRKAMEGVAGVQSVDIDFDGKTATVVFDPSVVTAAAIAAASTNAGYPAQSV